MTLNCYIFNFPYVKSLNTAIYFLLLFKKLFDCLSQVGTYQCSESVQIRINLPDTVQIRLTGIQKIVIKKFLSTGRCMKSFFFLPQIVY